MPRGNLRVVTCSSCKARIEWYETGLGRRMPMNAGAVALKIEGGGPTPEFGIFDAADSHFATCPDANAHRKS